MLRPRGNETDCFSREGKKSDGEGVEYANKVELQGGEGRANSKSITFGKITQQPTSINCVCVGGGGGVNT